MASTVAGENPVFESEIDAKKDDDAMSDKQQAILREIQVARAALDLKMREFERDLRARHGLVVATPVDEVDDPGASENGGLLVYASNAARRVFAQKVTVPACFHQVTTIYLLDEAQPMRQKMLFLCSSVFLLLLQTMTLNAVASGVSAPACVHSSDCQYGSYCSEMGYCTTCLMGDGVTPRVAGAVLSGSSMGAKFVWVDESALNATQFCASIESETTEATFCQACHDSGLPGDHWNTGKTMQQRMQDATNRMRGGDWAAMVLVACVVGLYCAGELRDIKLCQLTFEQRDGHSAPGWIRAVLFVLVALRQYSFLPNVVHIVAMLIMHRGSDAISICFNALAVLFLLDIDTALFQFWIPERIREEMEEFGMPTLRDIDASYLASVKRSHTVLVAFWVTAAVKLAGSNGGQPMAQGLTNLAFFFGGIYEAVTRARLYGGGGGGGGSSESLIGALGKWFGAFVIGGIWGFGVMLSMVGADWCIMYADYQAEVCGLNSAAQQPNCVEPAGGRA
eukprot:COSAG05_NODE_3_length_51333_cov_129.132080_26_plen_509_part_00